MMMIWRHLLTSNFLLQGVGMNLMWQKMYRTQAVLGGCYWAGIDDQFYLPAPGYLVGYGPWGFLDGWRRQKPESFLIRNSYTTVSISFNPADPSKLTVENRHDVTPLSDVTFTWSLNGHIGVGNSSVLPRQTGTLTLFGLPTDRTGRLFINATSPRGFLINNWRFDSETKTHYHSTSTPKTLRDGSCTVTSGNITWMVSENGSLTAKSNGSPVLLQGPQLLVIPQIFNTGQIQPGKISPPATSPCTGFVASQVACGSAGSNHILVQGSYPEATGQYIFDFETDGSVNIRYNFSWTGRERLALRQYGLALTLPYNMSSLSWQRRTDWPSVYPSDHIGRESGQNVQANPGPSVVYTSSPSKPWSQDTSPLGTNDFRSTKHNISTFTLAYATAVGNSLTFISSNTQHGRAWVNSTTTAVSMACLEISNEGGNPFSRERVLPQKTIQAGSILAGTVKLKAS